MHDEGRTESMDESLGVYEKAGEPISKARRTMVDNYYPSPAERFLKVKKALKAIDPNDNLMDWDLICFCSFILVQMRHAFEWLSPEIETMVRNVVYAHYYDPDTNCGKESRRTLEEFRKQVLYSEGQYVGTGKSENGNSVPIPSSDTTG